MDIFALSLGQACLFILPVFETHQFNLDSLVGLTSADDPIVLEWASQEGRVLLTHDVATITQYAYERVEAGLSMSGVFEMSLDVPISRAIEDILLLAECSLDGEWEGQIRYLPL